jgi:hypothetical protein
MFGPWLAIMAALYLAAAALALLVRRLPVVGLTLAHLGTAAGALAGLSRARVSRRMCRPAAPATPHPTPAPAYGPDWGYIGSGRTARARGG